MKTLNLRSKSNKEALRPAVRILFVADTHLGFDLPFKTRIRKRRRGPDFFANFKTALEPALKGEVDLVVHGGDLLYRSKVPVKLVNMAFEPLRQVADTGTPVYLVPGNHERSAIPFRLLAAHPNIHIFHRPKTYSLQVNGLSLALAGFPYVQEGIRQQFSRILEETGYKKRNADVYLLCIHHCVEGASVGPNNYTFRSQDFVVKMADIPIDFTAVLSGHIHRFQVLTKNLTGMPIPVPVFYPGSLERTSFAERNEKKGYLSLEIVTTGPMRRKPVNWEFHELPARPMVLLQLQAGGKNRLELKSRLKSALESLPEDSVVKIKIMGRIEEDAVEVLRAASLRALVPSTMNVSLAITNNAGSQPHQNPVFVKESKI